MENSTFAPPPFYIYPPVSPSDNSVTPSLRHHLQSDTFPHVFLTLFPMHHPMTPYAPNGAAIWCISALHLHHMRTPFARFQIVICLCLSMTFWQTPATRPSHRGTPIAWRRRRTSAHGVWRAPDERSFHFTQKALSTHTFTYCLDRYSPFAKQFITKRGMVVRKSDFHTLLLKKITIFAHYI